MDDGDEPPQNGTEGAGMENDSGPEPRIGPAAETDFHALAEDWIAIWQSEITAYLTDPETQQVWASIMAVWGEAAQAMIRAMPAAPGFTPGFGAAFGQGFAPGARPAPSRAKSSAPHDRRQKPKPSESAGTDAAPRAAPSAAAPVARDDEVSRLAQRVAELERHLATWERAEQERRRGALGENRRTNRPGRPRG